MQGNRWFDKVAVDRLWMVGMWGFFTLSFVGTVVLDMRAGDYWWAALRALCAVISLLIMFKYAMAPAVRPGQLERLQDALGVRDDQP